jgi:hypothetical protein
MTSGISLSLVASLFIRAAAARRKAMGQTKAPLEGLKGLSSSMPELKEVIRAMSSSCGGRPLQVTRAVVLDNIDEKATAGIVMALGQSRVKVETQDLTDGDAVARWLFRHGVKFRFETNEDPETILPACKGISTARGWGGFRAATSGMLKGGGLAPRPMCAFCGAELGRPVVEVPADQVE